MIRSVVAGVVVGLFGSVGLSVRRSEPRPAPIPRPMPSAEVLLVGDCQAWGWTYDGVDTFASFQRRVQNLGLPSYRVRDLERDVERLRGTHADTVIVHIGAADVSTDQDPGEVAFGILESVRHLKDVVPDARILILEVLPRQDREMEGKVEVVNAILRDELSYPAIWDGGYWGIAEFVDLDMSSSDTFDGVHLDEAGYRKLGDQIRDHLDLLPVGDDL